MRLERSDNGQTTKTNGQGHEAGGRRVDLPDTTVLIAQAYKLRTTLHDLMHQASSLAKALKQHRPTSVPHRALQSPTPRRPNGSS
jgi:hypothetical protein